MKRQLITAHMASMAGWAVRKSPSLQGGEDVKVAYGLVYEINASMIRRFLKEGSSSVRIRLSEPNEDGFSRIIYGNTTTNSAVHGIPLEMDMAA